MTRRFRWVLGGALLLFAAAAVAGIAEPRAVRAADVPAAKTVTVTGTGTVTTVPDRASFSFTVESRASTARAALSRNADDAAAMIAALRNAGVADADLQTGEVSLSTVMSQDGTQVIGYSASNTVSAQTTIGKAGALVDAAVGAGATGVSGPMLSRSDSDTLYKEALKAAVADAGGKARALAGAAGLTLGGVETMVEGSQTPVVWSAAKAGADTPTPIEPGTQDVEATVTVTYSLG